MRVNKNVITLIEHKVLIHGMGTVTLTISMSLRQKKACLFRGYSSLAYHVSYP